MVWVGAAEAPPQQAVTEMGKLSEIITAMKGDTTFGEFEQLGYNNGVFFMHLVCAGLALYKKKEEEEEDVDAAEDVEGLLARLKAFVATGKNKELRLHGGVGAAGPSVSDEAVAERHEMMADIFKAVKDNIFKPFAVKVGKGK